MLCPLHTGIALLPPTTYVMLIQYCLNVYSLPAPSPKIYIKHWQHYVSCRRVCVQLLPASFLNYTVSMGNILISTIYHMKRIGKRCVEYCLTTPKIIQ